jgi:chromosome segregation ATPase
MEIATRRREQEVWQACDDLWSMHGDMRNLTGDAIKERLLSLGKSRGSPNEIYKYRKTWVKSRGLVNNQGSFGEKEDCDPITRAVRLVHEQLRNETADKIENLQNGFQEQLTKKDIEITKIKKDLDDLMAEYNRVQREFDTARKEGQKLNECLRAEIDIRKASEKELMQNQALQKKENQAHQVLIDEIKSLHKDEIALLLARHNESETQAKMQIDHMLEEKKQLGFEFSERLNEIRMSLYNSEQINKQLKKTIAEQVSQLNSFEEKIVIKIKQEKIIKKENMDLKENLAKISIELKILNENRQEVILENKRLLIEIKKAQLTIARLRAYRRGENLNL